MKRYSTLLLPTLLTAVFLTLEATPVRAQTTLSLMGGVNFASMNTDFDDALAPDLEFVTRMSVGLAATIPVTDRFGVQLGGRYVQKGGSLDLLGMAMRMFGRLEGMEQVTSFETDFRMDYVEFSALARVRFPLSGDRMSGHLLAGPALGLQSSCEVGVRIREPGFPEADFNMDCEEFGPLFKGKLDLGLAGGAGIDIGLTDSIDAHLGLLYTLGLSNVVDDDDETMKHRALTIRAGLVLPIG